MVGFQPGGLVGGQGEGCSVRLGETEAAEPGEHRPGAVDHGGGEPAIQGALPHVLLDPGKLLRFAEVAAEDIRSAEPATGQFVEQTHHLLVEDHDTLGLPQERFEPRVDVVGQHLPVPGLEVFQRHVVLHRSGPEQGDLHGEIVEDLGLQLADQLHLTRRFDLEDAEGAGGADQFEGRRVVERDPVEVDGLARQPVVFLDGMGHGRLHPHTEDIELDQAHRVHVVLVELRHWQPHAGALHRRPVEK